MAQPDQDAEHRPGHQAPHVSHVVLPGQRVLAVTHQGLTHVLLREALRTHQEALEAERRAKGADAVS